MPNENLEMHVHLGDKICPCKKKVYTNNYYYMPIYLQERLVMKRNIVKCYNYKAQSYQKQCISKFQQWITNLALNLVPRIFKNFQKV